MARENAYTRFLRDPDVEARRAELEAYIGPNAAPFLKVYERLRERPERPRFGAFTSFVAMAFFLGPCWFFYRRMWVWAWAIVAVMVAVGFVPQGSRLGVPLAVGLALMGRYAYLQHAFVRIEQLRGAGPAADPQALRLTGGVSRAAGWASTVVYLVVVALALAAMIVFIAQGGDPEALR